MTETDPLAAFSDAIERRVRDAAPQVVGLECGQGQLSGILWRDGVMVTSEQSLPRGDSFTAVLPGGARVAATLAGRDSTTNVAALRLEADAPVLRQSEPSGVGGVVLAIGSDGSGAATARLGTVEVLGAAWESQRGGRIDRLMRIGVRLGRGAEGGPVIDARGALLGMSTFGPRQSVLVIPGATIGRVVEQLLTQGRIMRGWLGAGLQAVALPATLGAQAQVGSGLMVVSLATDGPAAGALMPGDILLEIAGATVATPRAVASALGPDTIGRSLSVKLIRGGGLLTLDITITARPA